MATEPGPSADELSGQRISSEGRFLVLRKLGKAAFGEVYLAPEDKHGINVAVKILRQTESPITVERFKREDSKYSLRFKHPNVVEVLKCWRQRGRFFIAMEFVEGRTLAEIIDSEGAFAVDEALRSRERSLSGSRPGTGPRRSIAT